MFENIIAQAAALQLSSDILSRTLAPSMLFFGPPASGKGSTAIELARSLSCEKEAAWNCPCPSCVRHRSLIHPDLAMIGPRNFAAEIAASKAAFLRDPASLPGRALFIRSLRKLLARFAPAVWEYEPKSGKGSPLPLLQSLEEELDDLETFAAGMNTDGEFGVSDTDAASLGKRTGSLLQTAVKLEDEHISESIPIAQIRRAAYWSRLSPAGKRKILVIENAGRMKDEARNSLLKLLEEPPETVCVVLTAGGRESLLPTIVSRLRPYRFLARSAADEAEIIRRVFRDPSGAPEAGCEKGKNAGESLVGAYLNSFLPQPPGKMLPLAAFFVAAAARSAAALVKSRGTAIPPALAAIGGYCAPIAEAAGFERCTETREVIAVLLSRSSNFEGRSFPLFLSLTQDLVSWLIRECSPDPGLVSCAQVWKNRLAGAHAAYGVWNQTPSLALEALFCRLREDMAS